MARIDEDDAARLLAALNDESPGAAEAAPSEPSRAEAPDLGRLLAQTLASYLKRPVRATAGRSAPELIAAWRYEGQRGAARWLLDLDALLGASIADALIGGAGEPTPAATGDRSRAMIEPVATLIAGCAAQALAVAAPKTMLSRGVGAPVPNAKLGGTLAVATAAYGWRLAIADPTSADDTAATLGGDAIANAVSRARARIATVVRGHVGMSQPRTERVESPSLPQGRVGLALSGGGEGAMVVSIDKRNVAALAGAALQTPLPALEEPGDVVRGAAEVVLRAALVGFAEALPGLGDVPQRIVPLDEGALPARSMHRDVSVDATICGFAVPMHWLVPEWMAPTA